jgi:hypothetical protein
MKGIQGLVLSDCVVITKTIQVRHDERGNGLSLCNYDTACLEQDIYLFDDAANRAPNPINIDPLARFTAFILFGFVSQTLVLCAKNA